LLRFGSADRRVWVGRFGADQFCPINDIPQTIPPLRERPKSLVPLLHRFTEQADRP